MIGQFTAKWTLHNNLLLLRTHLLNNTKRHSFELSNKLISYNGLEIDPSHCSSQAPSIKYMQRVFESVPWWTQSDHELPRKTTSTIIAELQMQFKTGPEVQIHIAVVHFIIQKARTNTIFGREKNNLTHRNAAFTNFTVCFATERQFCKLEAQAEKRGPSKNISVYCSGHISRADEVPPVYKNVCQKIQISFLRQLEIDQLNEQTEAKLCFNHIRVTKPASGQELSYYLPINDNTKSNTSQPAVDV